MGHHRTFGVQPVKDLLELADIYQTDVARRAGISQAGVCRMVNGERPPSLPVVEALEELLGRPVSELFELERYERCHWYRRELRTGHRRPGGGAA